MGQYVLRAKERVREDGCDLPRYQIRHETDQDGRSKRNFKNPSEEDALGKDCKTLRNHYVFEVSAASIHQ